MTNRKAIIVLYVTFAIFVLLTVLDELLCAHRPTQCNVDSPYSWTDCNCERWIWE